MLGAVDAPRSGIAGSVRTYDFGPGVGFDRPASLRAEGLPAADRALARGVPARGERRLRRHLHPVPEHRGRDTADGVVRDRRRTRGGTTGAAPTSGGRARRRAPRSTASTSCCIPTAAHCRRSRSRDGGPRRCGGRARCPGPSALTALLGALAAGPARGADRVAPRPVAGRRARPTATCASPASTCSSIVALNGPALHRLGGLPPVAERAARRAGASVVGAPGGARQQVRSVRRHRAVVSLAGGEVLRPGRGRDRAGHRVAHDGHDRRAHGDGDGRNAHASRVGYDFGLTRHFAVAVAGRDALRGARRLRGGRGDRQRRHRLRVADRGGAGLALMTRGRRPTD